MENENLIRSRKEIKPNKTYKFLKWITKIAIKKPEFIFLGEPFKESSLILSNHSGSSGPLSLELYSPIQVRLLGTYEMNGSLKDVYKYLSTTYYYQKKHWNKYLAKAFCLIAAPLVHSFYKGLNLISTYQGIGFVKTIKESYEALTIHKENLVIFPEDSSKGYFTKLTHFYNGFLVLAEYCYKRGLDLDIYVAYLNRRKRKYIFDKPIKYSELIKLSEDKDEIAKMLLNRCNELGKM